MILERSMHPEWLSNTYLVGDEPGGTAVVIDSGGPSAPLLEKVEEHDLDVTHLLLTHHHADHVAENSVYKERFGAEILAHPLEARELMDVDRTIEPGETVLETGGLSIGALITPGHTAGMLNFVVNGDDVFTGDTLFKGSVGGVKAPGSTTFADLKHSVMEVLMKLPPETRLHPGPHRSHDRGGGVGVQSLRPGLARAGRGVIGPLHRVGAARDPGPVGARLRRRAQGLGALGRVR